MSFVSVILLAIVLIGSCLAGAPPATLSLKWAYLKGPLAGGGPGKYASLGSYDSTVLPKSQMFSRAVKDSNGIVWLVDKDSLAGEVFSFNGADFRWVYRSSKGDALGVYTGADPHPGKRASPMLWPRPEGGFAMFGGISTASRTHSPTMVFLRRKRGSY